MSVGSVSQVRSFRAAFAVCPGKVPEAEKALAEMWALHGKLIKNHVDRIIREYGAPEEAKGRPCGCSGS